jgi:trehalose-6-phosphatase
MKQFTGLAVGILKGRAMHCIASALKAKALNFHHIYIGDDITDEDAFNVLPEKGYWNSGRTSWATFLR